MTRNNSMDLPTRMSLLHAGILCITLLVLACTISCAGSEHSEQEKTPEETPPASQQDASPPETAPQKEATPEAPPPEAPVPEEKPVDRFGSAAEFMREGNVEQAMTELEKAIEESPEDTETKLAYAMLLLSEGKIEEAAKSIGESMEQDPENADAVFLHSTVLYLQGDDPGRLDELNRTLELDPRHADAHAALGEIHATEGETAEAERHFTLSLERDPENIPALLGFGGLMMREEEYDHALELYNRAVTVSSENPISYIDRSRAYRAMEQFETAEEDLSTAIELMPEYYWNYIDRGKLRLFQLGDMEGALQDFTDAVSIDPELFYAYVYRAGILDDMNRYREALEDYRRVIADKPDYQFAYLPMGKLAYILNDGAAARRYFNKARAYEPGEVSFTFMNYLCYLRDDEEERANEYLRKELPGVPREDIFYHIGRAFLEPGYYSMASRRLHELQDPILKARIKFYLGEYQLLNGADMLAADLFLEVLVQEMPANLEYKLAEWRLDEMGIR